MKQKIIFALFIQLLFACQESAQKSSDSQSKERPLPIAGIAPVSKLNTDTIHYDTLVYPIEENFEGKLLYPGEFHEGEVWPNASSEKWIGIFESGKNCYLAKTKIKLQKVFDAIMDEDTIQVSGVAVSASHKDTALFLFSGLEELKERSLSPQSITLNPVYPGDTVHLTFGDNTYKIYASGGKRNFNPENNFYEVWNYKLFVDIKTNDTIIHSLIISQPQFNDNMIKFLFSADLNGDGFLDFIIDKSANYNSIEPTLFISKPKDKNRFYKVVASHTATGC